jgi:hypothetical protein
MNKNAIVSRVPIFRSLNHFIALSSYSFQARLSRSVIMPPMLPDAYDEQET